MSFDLENAVRQARLLPPRQKQVLREIANGMEQKEIAENTGMALNTVRCTRTLIYSRLGIHNSREAVRVALKAGLVK